MKVICNQCGKILDVMLAHTLAVDGGGHLTTYHFCSDRHTEEFAQGKVCLWATINFSQTL